jgi:hypothetical protein
MSHRVMASRCAVVYPTTSLPRRDASDQVRMAPFWVQPDKACQVGFPAWPRLMLLAGGTSRLRAPTRTGAQPRPAASLPADAVATLPGTVTAILIAKEFIADNDINCYSELKETQAGVMSQ